MVHHFVMKRRGLKMELMGLVLSRAYKTVISELLSEIHYLTLLKKDGKCPAGPYTLQFLA